MKPRLPVSPLPPAAVANLRFVGRRDAPGVATALARDAFAIAPTLPTTSIVSDAPAASASGAVAAALTAAPLLHLNIERLRLQARSSSEGQRIAASLQAELRRLADTQPWPTEAQATEALHLPPLQRAPGERPETTGRRLAQRIATQWGSR
jgi:hypothetical protein